MSVISKILMKHHLNVHHSNNNLLCGDELRKPQGQAAEIKIGRICLLGDK
jgi:hypothetical protein